MEENEYIKMGAYHTIDLELNRKFTIFKEQWDSVTLERVETACDPAAVSSCCAYSCVADPSFTCVLKLFDLPYL